MAETGCISDTDLKAFVLGALPERQAATAARHLETSFQVPGRVGSPLRSP
jgi:hypothetical protein